VERCGLDAGSEEVCSMELVKNIKTFKSKPLLMSFRRFATLALSSNGHSR
jgi:hypothetical protein